MGKINLEQLLNDWLEDTQYRHLAVEVRRAINKQVSETERHTLFKKGEWAINSKYPSKPIHIDTIINGNYHVSDIFGDKCMFNHKIFDKNYHLWNIIEAKDGDVLSGTVDNDYVTLIFKEITQDGLSAHIAYHRYKEGSCGYCRLDEVFQKTKTKYQFHPATKEEWETFLNNIRENGYEWSNVGHEVRVIGEQTEPKELASSSPSFVKQQEDNTWYSATDFKPNHLQRCLCWDKYLKDVYCYKYDDENKYWTTIDFHDGYCHHVSDYNDYRITVWMKMPIPTFVSNCDTEPKELNDVKHHKFRIGNYIVNDYCQGKVVEITNDAYILDTEQGIPFSYEHNARLWTLQDAKIGEPIQLEVESDGVSGKPKGCPSVVKIAGNLISYENGWVKVNGFLCYKPYNTTLKQFIIESNKIREAHPLKK